MAQLRLRLFGGFRAETTAGRALSVPNRKDQALVSYLAMGTHRQHSRDTLASLLWGTHNESSARHSLRQALTTLRKRIFPKGGVVTSRNTVLVRSAAVDLDVAAFEDSVAEGTRESFERAVTLFTGEFLEGLIINEEPFEEWVQGERQRLRKTLHETYHALVTLYREKGELDRAVQCYAQLMAQDPFNEELLRNVMVLMAESGRRPEALQIFDRFSKRLRRELDVEPESYSREIYLGILEGRSSKAGESGLAAAEGFGLVEAFRSLDGFVVWDDKDRFVMCNDKFREIFSASKELLRPGVSWEEIIRSAAEQGRFPDAVGNVDAWVTARRGRRRAGTHEARALAINDGRVYRLTHRRTEGGGLVVVLTEARERRQQEIDLFRAEARYQALVRAFPHGIEEVDTRGKILFSNPVHHRMLGYEPGELQGKHLREIMSVPWIRIAAGDGTGELGKQEKISCTYISKLGRKIDTWVSWSYVRDDTGKVAGYIAVVIEANAEG